MAALFQNAPQAPNQAAPSPIPQGLQQGLQQQFPTQPKPQLPDLLSILGSFLPTPKPQVDASPQALARQFEAVRQR